MQLVLTTDTTTLSYWLNWRVLLCAIWVLTSIVIASYLIWKYEGPGQPKAKRGETPQDVARIVYADEAWRPCIKEIHPIWLLLYRVIAFCLLLTALIVKVNANGFGMFYYYTQWTFTLVTIYFGILSAMKILGFKEEIDALHAAGTWGYIFQIMFQMNAGAVMLTDSLYWIVIFPFLTIKDYNLNFMTVNMHTLNAIVLLGDTALNCLRFPWFRISYFILWTAIFVIFQWIIHACVLICWPYPFLDLSSPYAPLWYFLVALMHIPCYAIFALIVEMKHYLVSKWFPESYQR